MFLFGRHSWRGESGRRHVFRTTLTDRGLPARGGVYIFVRSSNIFWLKALYVGKAVSLKGRLTGHERWAEAWWRRGATERHVLACSSEAKRREIEEDLIRGLKPVMNDMLLPREPRDAPANDRLRRRWKRGDYWLARPRRKVARA